MNNQMNHHWTLFTISLLVPVSYRGQVTDLALAFALLPL